MFLAKKDINFAACVDNSIPYFFKHLKVLPSKLQICALKLLEWFSNNYMKMNSDKCHLINLFLVLMILTMKIRK